VLKLWKNFSGQIGMSHDVPLKEWAFPCGESGVKIDGQQFVTGWDCTIQLLWENDSDLIKLCQLVDALRHERVGELTLEIPYFPYSRQDRRCMPGEGHSLKVVGAVINSLGFVNVRTLDAHSTVLEAVVDRLTVIPQGVCALGLPQYDMLIAPDAGAAKKVYQHSQVEMFGTSVMTADKKREGSKVKAFLHTPWAVADLNVCVVDDLCDGGATFTELGKLVKPHKPAKLDLYVTHGFFTKGLDALLEIYDNIYVHNLMRPEFRARVKEI
jgi:ribose-phosphate pyrophosphokinase